MKLRSYSVQRSLVARMCIACLMGLMVLCLAGCPCATPTQLTAQEAQQMLDAHNSLRTKYNVPALTSNYGLECGAQAWANQLASSGTFVHSNSEGAYGENLFMGSGSYTPAQVAQMWSAEESQYHGEAIDNQNYQIFGHFTQMVWGKTTELGCGKAAGSGGEYWVCRYSPAGNVIGQKPF